MKKKLTFDLEDKEINIFSSINKLDKQDKHNITLYECERICPKNSSHGILALTKNYLIYQVDTTFDINKYDKDEKYLFSSLKSDLDQSQKQIIIPYNLISQILYRKFLFFDQSLELFLFNGKSYFFNLYSESNRNLVTNSLKEKIKKKTCEIIENSADYFKEKNYLKLWQEGKKTTLEYLLLVNKFSNRSYNVLTQYLVLPWLLLDFDNIYVEKNYRNMSFPTNVQTEQAINKILNEYKNEKGEYLYFSQKYISQLYVNNYLIRCYPYINNQIQCQNGKFEDPERQIDYLLNYYTKELIPEFYYIPEIFLNLNYCFYGKSINKNTLTLINNIIIGKGFNSILHFINFHVSFLNSDTFNSTINKWIDYIFGKSQIPNTENIFFYKYKKIISYEKETYEAIMRKEIIEKLKQLKQKDIKTQKEIINEIRVIINRAYSYGPCPSQLFAKEHPTPNKKSDKKINNSSNFDRIKSTLKYDCINLKEKNFVYIRESTNANFFYILFENRIDVYDMQLKFINRLSISKIYPPYSFIFEDKLEQFYHLQYMYKYLIFDIDCKYFFVAGYLDNSFRIYTKEKEKNIKYSIYTENNVTCIRKYNNSNLFFTGHQNGKLIKWMYLETNNDDLKKDDSLPLINVEKISSLCAHQSYVKIIEISDKYEYIVTADEEGLVFIRKLYDFELLSYIKINKYKKQVIDINLNNQIIILSVYIIKKKSSVIYKYSLNGLKLGKIDMEIKLPINAMPETDKIMIFGLSNIYLINIYSNESSSLINYSLLDDNNNGDKKYYLISFFCDLKNRVLFVLFSNGNLYRVNFN